MTMDIYRDLQQRLDSYSLGFPATETGIELEILKSLFSTDDAAMFLSMTPKLETAQQIAARTDREVPAVTEQLEDMTKRGLLFRLKKAGTVRYGAIPFVHGVFEFQVKDLKPELAAMVEQYHKEGFNQAFENSHGMFLRTVPVQKSIDVLHQVAAYDDAVGMLREKDPIVVTDCICRKQKTLVGKGCDKTMEACFMFGSMGQYYLDKGMGRQVDVEEAIAILKKAQETGLVTQPATNQNPAGMCNCCGDCCGVLRSLREYPKPASMVYSNHFAQVDQAECSGCETCLDRCQMDAISMNADDLAAIDMDRCIGCGLCVDSCPTEAIGLVAKPDKEHYTPPATTAEQMMTMAQARGLL